MKWADGTKDIDIAIPAGSRKIELVVSREGRRGYDYANWAAARIERAQ